MNLNQNPAGAARMDALHYDLLLILSLLFTVFILCMLSEKLQVSYPVLLVIGGLLISLIPGVPHIAIDPELIFLIILPPLLYEAAWNTSWHHLWKRKRTVALLAFGLVLFTSCMLAFLSQAIIPGFTLALGFVLGGIVAPTDSISAVFVLKGKKVPRRVQTILEGESLVNDAASLIVFRFALAAVISGQFKLQTAAMDFFIVTVMGILIGFVIAYIIYFIYKYLPNIPSIDTSLTLMAPYIMYAAAEHFEFSGVMAVVSGGLLLSYRSHNFLNYDSRIQTNNVWSTVSFLLNGAVFILIGLQLPIIVGSLDNNDTLSLAVFYGSVISFLTLFIRFIWVYPAIFIPRMVSRKIRQTENNPGWRSAFLISWAGMRGMVSLASALSLPLVLADGNPFPHRNLILFITFIVILFSLLVQGLSLSFIVKKLKIKEFDTKLSEEEQEASIRLRLSEASLSFINSKYAKELSKYNLLIQLKQHYENIASLMYRKIERDAHPEGAKATVYNLALLEVIALQRKELAEMHKDIQFDTELLRKHETLLDLEESKINISVSGDSPGVN